MGRLRISGNTCIATEKKVTQHGLTNEMSTSCPPSIDVSLSAPRVFIDDVTGKGKGKPGTVVDYINMRTVDKSDAVVFSSACAMKNMKSYWKLFFNLHCIPTHNSQMLHRAVAGLKYCICTRRGGHSAN